jgi:hypothetical protein
MHSFISLFLLKHFRFDEGPQAVEISSMELDVIVAGASDPQRLNGGRTLFVNANAM